MGNLKKAVHPAWVMVFAGAIITAVGIGAYNSTNSVFVKPVCDELGLNRADFTLHRTIITLVGVCFLPLYGKLIRRIGIKPILLTSSVAIGLITIGYSFSTQLWNFYVLAVINGAFMNGVTFMTVGVLISSWFEDKKGLAMGVAYCGSGVGSAVMVPIVSGWIEQFGWQGGYRWLTIVGMILLLPAVLIVREYNASTGDVPYRSKKTQENLSKKERQFSDNQLFLKDAMRTPTFWLLLIASLSLGICAAGPMTHSIPYLTDIGYSTNFASSVFSVFAVTLAIGKILLGILFDRFGSLAGSLIVGICCVISPLLALLSSFPGVPWIYAVFMGIASCGISVPVNVLLINYFGEKDFPALLSFYTMVMTLSMSLSVPMMGAIYDTWGSYVLAWKILEIFALLAVACLVGAYVMRKRMPSKGTVRNS